MKATRDGFGEGIVLAAQKNERIVALSADLAGSTKLTNFIHKFPKRYFGVGVAEQNLVTVASGLAHVGKIPFVTSFAAFSPGRNWEQIRTTICYNDQNVKIVGTHTGLGVGEDGATHQMLEDIALMRALPNMQVIVPCDAIQAKKATLALAKSKKPAYLRLNRQKSPILTTERLPFKIGQAQVVREGRDVTLIGCGPIMAEVIEAAARLEEQGIDALVINCHTIKPLDTKTITAAAKKTGAVVTVEDHQITGGLGGAIAEHLSGVYPVPIIRIGMPDHFGESGPAEQLFEKYGLTAQAIVKAAKKVMK